MFTLQIFECKIFASISNILKDKEIFVLFFIVLYFRREENVERTWCNDDVVYIFIRDDFLRTQWSAIKISGGMYWNAQMYYIYDLL